MQSQKDNRTSGWLPCICTTHAMSQVITGAVCLLQASSFRYRVAIIGEASSDSLVWDELTDSLPARQSWQSADLQSSVKAATPALYR